MELVIEETQLRMEEEQEKARLLSWDCGQVYDEKLKQELEDSFSYVYPYEAQALIPSKLTVSEVKRMQEPVQEESYVLYEEKPVETYVPAFMREKEATPQGAARGTIYHRVLENLDYGKTEDLDQIKAQIKALGQQGKLTKIMEKTVRGSGYLSVCPKCSGTADESGNGEGEALSGAALCYGSICQSGEAGI